MIMVFFNWLYIGITSFLTGFAILSLFTRLFPYKSKSILLILLTGLMSVTVYAEYFSLFAGVSICANVMLVMTCFLIAVIMRKKIAQLLMEKWHYACNHKIYSMVILIMLVIFLYGTSRGYIHFDTGLYHAQSIRWIEEYGVVKGLANLHIRFAYNSSAFALNALYSMKALTGQSFHATAGFLAFISAIPVLDLYKIVQNKTIRYADLVRLSLIYYLAVIYGEMVSPASDYYAQLLIFDILLLWTMALEERKEENINSTVPFSLCCILLVFALSVKFSIGLLLLLVLKPAVELIQKKEIKQIFICLLSGIVVILPFMIRNYLISGWLVYPSTFPDLFHTDWKIPKGQAQCDALEIGAYGKGLNDVTKWDTPFKDWVPNWFAQLNSMERLWVFASAFALICGVAYFIIRLKKIKQEKDALLLFGVMSLAALFWFFKAPLIRYGYAYITLFPMLTLGYLFIKQYRVLKENGKKIVWIAFLAFTIIFGLFNLKKIGYSIVTTMSQNYYLTQKEYPDGDATTYEIDGITIYVPTYQGQIGYDKFPSSPAKEEIELRGEGLKDGFRKKNY